MSKCNEKQAKILDVDLSPCDLDLENTWQKTDFVSEVIEAVIEELVRDLPINIFSY